MLPHWPAGTVTILSTSGEAPHAIPVSVAIRAGPRHALLGIAHRRRSLERLRDDGRVALTILAPGTAATVHGRAQVVEHTLVEGVAAVEVEAHRVQDHRQPTFAIEDGVSWHWTDHAAERRDAEVRDALARLAAEYR